MGYAAVAFLILRQWGTPDPYGRIDVFVVGYFVLLPLWMLEHIGCCHGSDSSPEIRHEALGTGYDPGLVRFATPLRALQLAALAEYAHWQLAPALATPALRWLGLALYGLSLLWLMWADRVFLAHFREPDWKSHLMTEGPYALVRHPRYSGTLVSHVGFALLFASVIGWVLAVFWIILVYRRIHLEERYLIERYGAAYLAYAGKTARLVPGIY